MSLPIAVIRTTQDVIQDVGGRPIDALRVEFRVGDNGPFYIRLKRDEFTDVRVREEMRKIADVLESLNRA